MTIDIKQEATTVVAELKGRLDTNAAVESAGVFNQLTEQADKTIVMDCSELEYISSSGLRLFISLRKASAAQGGAIIIKHMNDNIRNVFAMTGFSRLFTIED